MFPVGLGFDPLPALILITHVGLDFSLVVTLVPQYQLRPHLWHPLQSSAMAWLALEALTLYHHLLSAVLN